MTTTGNGYRKRKTHAIIYEGLKLDHGYRIDILVENKIVAEIKAVEAFARVHFEQVLTYLRLGNFKVGLLLNFHVMMLKDGMKRIVNEYAQRK
ncbi:MAG: GxxExxY protein [Chryseolinea sp.]